MHGGWVFNWNINLKIQHGVLRRCIGCTTFCWCWYYERFFCSSSGFGLLWQVSFEFTGCFFLLVSWSKWFPFEKVILLCFVFISLRFGFVLSSFFLLVFAFLACSLRLFCFSRFFPCIRRGRLWAVCLVACLYFLLFVWFSWTLSFSLIFLY